MFKSLLPLLVLSSSLAFADSNRLKNFESSYSFSLEGKSNQNIQAQSQLVGTKLGVSVDYWFQDNFFVDSDLNLAFYTGHIQSLETDKTSNQTISLNNVSANYVPYSSSRISVGALSPKQIHSSLLLENNPFPAVRADLKTWEQSQGMLNFYIQNAITTNSSLSTNTKELEPTPELRTIGFRYSMGGKQNFVTNQLSYFSFNNLSTSIATDSALKGNTTNAISSLEREFTYSYYGVDFSSKAQIEINKRLSALTTVSYLKNQGADTGLNTAYLLKLGGIYYLKNHSIEISSGFFRIEPDATVSTYSSSQYFFTNRTGYTTEATLNFHQSQFSVKIAYTDAQTIFQSIDQNKEQLILLKLETKYANL